MTRNNVKNYIVMFVLILSATSMVQNNAFAATIHPNLGTAGNFAVLGASTVTNTGNTVLTGNLGVSPGTAITGFPPGKVIGTIYAGGPVATQAHADAATAYGALSSATCTTNEPAVATIGGQTLKPGVYCFPTSAAITGTLTLSGNGVYIFKIGSTLTTAAGNSQVVLTNGASASNVFWQVGSSATLGTGSVFKGTIIAYSSITATTNALVDGRLIALNGAVTLDTNHITVAVQHNNKK
ncbi:MAG: ice-binding family protein [Nitrosotalea sp.]